MQTGDNLTIEKEKIWKGYSYVLKTSLLKEALAEAKTDIDTHLRYIPREYEGIFLARFWIPNERIPYNRLYITASSVPSEQHKNAFEEFKSKAIPAFIDWLTSTLAMPENSPALCNEPFFKVEWKEEKMEIDLGFNKM